MHAVADARAADAVVPVGARVVLVVPVGVSVVPVVPVWCQLVPEVLVVLDSTTVQGTVVGRVGYAPALLKAVPDGHPE